MTNGKVLLLALIASAAATGGFAVSGSISDRLSDAFIDRLSVAMNSTDACGGPLWAGVSDSCFASTDRLAVTSVRLATAPQSVDPTGDIQ